MKSNPIHREHYNLAARAMLCSALWILPAYAATDLADKPLANATTVELLPNIFFILDDSGSMNSDFMPDYVEGNYCRDNYTEDGGTNGDLNLCRFGDPPFMASAFNRIYYNPNFNYEAPKNYDGSSKTSYSTYTAVPLDGYGIQFTSDGSYPRDNDTFDNGRTITRDDWAHGRGLTLDLTNQFPERKWCTSGTNSGTCTSNTKTALNSSNAYIYPDSTNKYLHTTFGNPYYYNVTVEWCKNKNNSGTDKNYGSSQCQARKDSTHPYVKFSNWSRVDIVSTNNSYPGPNGSTRTYAQEMTNFANWFAWYRTRMQMTKSGVGRAFSNVRGTPNPSDTTDQDKLHARVGLTLISNTGTSDGNGFRKIDNFDSSQKQIWFDRLYNAVPSSWTPLRGALSKAGQYYAGNFITTDTPDPIQYSCQRNFTILSTDGYWNTNIENPPPTLNWWGSCSTTPCSNMHPASGSYGPFKIDGTRVADQDGISGVTRPSLDTGKYEDTLADVAYYYYHTDLRPGTCTKCTDDVTPAGSSQSEDDVATHQHMTTFTIGLGVDGTLVYQDGYRTSTSGDYYNIKQGTAGYAWPDPITNTGDQRIDDLWHAAVNGRGTYFSARDPDSLVAGLESALGAAEQKTGSGAAAATSNLEPTAGDNYIFIANYRTLKWDGELSAYNIDLNTGAVLSSNGTTCTATVCNPLWQASQLLGSRIGSDGNSFTATPRLIYTTPTSATTTLREFIWNNLTATEKGYFDTTQLSQYANWTGTEQTFAATVTGTGASQKQTLHDYLRGMDRNEDQDRATAYGTYYRLYRDREKILGDIVHSQPVYVKAPFYNYGDAGYTGNGGFKDDQADRSPTVYVAANDGMLHAFDGSGNERWAYIPHTVMPNLWRLADASYGNNHRFFVDGPIAVSDVYTGGSWKTILVGSLGKGGRGYYALDITSPTAPKFLWTFSNPNLGYSYGAPIITKLNGTWVVLVTSGYNNIPEGSSYPSANGEGYVWAINAGSGAIEETWATGVGSLSSPAGLANLNIKVADFDNDNSMLVAYGGDLYGNLWRFKTDGTKDVVINLGTDQPITSAPEIGDVDGKTVLYFGTGRYLGEDDLTNDKPQALYAVKDNGTSPSVKSNMKQKTISGTSVTGSDPIWSTDDGWYANLPQPRERVNLSPQLYFGTIVFATTIPTASECQPGGSGRLYFLDYKTGNVIGSNAAWVGYTSPIVGFTVAKLPGGTPKVYPITADGGFPKGEPPTLPISPNNSNPDSGRRILWREVIN